MRNTAVRFMSAALTLALVAAACGGSESLADRIDELRIQPAADVRPPSRADAERHAVPGFILATNSPSLQEMLGTPDGQGAVVLFVQPEGPADGRDIEAGDLLISVDGTPVVNHEHAVAFLRSRPGQSRELTFLNEDGGERSVRIEAEVPAGGALPHVESMLRENPNDPLLLYMRAREDRVDLETRLNDLTRALEQEPRFVEAIGLLAAITWSQRPHAQDEQREQLENLALRRWQAALDINPRHVPTLVDRSHAHTDLGQPNRGLSDAERAISLDRTNASALWALARAQLATGNLEEAAGPARAAIEINPYTNLLYYQTLAAIFMDLERPEDCTATVEAIAPFLEAHPGDDAEAFQAAARDLRQMCT